MDFGPKLPSISTSTSQRSAFEASSSTIGKLQLSLAKYAVPVGPTSSASTSNTPVLPSGRITAPDPLAGRRRSGRRRSSSASSGAPAAPAETEQVKRELDEQVQQAANPTDVPQAPLVEATDPMLAMTDPVIDGAQIQQPAPKRTPWARIVIGAGMVIGVWMLLRRR